MTGILEATDYKFDEDEVSLIDSMEQGLKAPLPVKLPSNVQSSLQNFDKYLESISSLNNIASTDNLAYSINKNTTALMINMLKRSMEEFYRMPNSATTSATLSIINTINQSLTKMKQTENSKDLPDKILAIVSRYIQEYIKSMYNSLKDKITILNLDKKLLDEINTEFKKQAEAADIKIGLLRDEIKREIEL